MLYDPKWEKQTKADPYSLGSLIAWLEKQPAGKRYDFHDCNGGCLIGMYYIANGVHNKSRDDYRPYTAVFGGSHDLYGQVAATLPYTFGAALERARAAR